MSAVSVDPCENNGPVIKRKFHCSLGAELLLTLKYLGVLGGVISERIFVFTEQLLEIIVFIQIPHIV